MTAPGTLMMAKMFVPETEQPETLGTVKLDVEKTDVNVIDAAGRGTGEGLHLALNVGAMLISFIALIALVNAHPRLRRTAWSAACPGSACRRSSAGCSRRSRGPGRAVARRRDGRQSARHAHGAERVRRLRAARRRSRRRSIRASFTIATFALCGFANFSSIGIQIGGIGALAPTRRHDLARLGLRAMLAGTLANFVTATIAGCCCDAGPLRRRRTKRPRRSQRSHRRRAGRRGRARLGPRRLRRLAATTPSWCRTRHPALAGVEVVGHAGKLVAGTDRGPPRAGAVGPRALLRRPRAGDGRPSRRASSAGSASRC